MVRVTLGKLQALNPPQPADHWIPTGAVQAHQPLLWITGPLWASRQRHSVASGRTARTNSRRATDWSLRLRKRYPVSSCIGDGAPTQVCGDVCQVETWTAAAGWCATRDDHNGIFLSGLNLPFGTVCVRGDGPAIDIGMAMTQTTAGRIFLGLLILVAPAALSLVHPIAGWAVLALVAGTLVAKKRGSRSTACEPGASSATDSSTVLNA